MKEGEWGRTGAKSKCLWARTEVPYGGKNYNDGYWKWK
jgi:hypothetical protein